MPGTVLFLSKFIMKNIALLFLMLTTFAHAGVQVGGTRLIYDGNDKSAVISLKNNEDYNYMIQTWLDNGNPTVKGQKFPVVVTPPIMKLDGGKEGFLKFIYSGKGLPEDKESMFWINIQEIPQASEKQNSVQIAVRTRIKLFYRPVALNTTLKEQTEKLEWQRSGGEINIVNKGVFHVTLGDVIFHKGAKKWKVNANMIAPGGTAHVRIPAEAGTYERITYTYINDSGALVPVDQVDIR
jgi:P pilus assembly protein, chaperone PapD